MEIAIKINGQVVSVEVSMEVYAYLEQSDRKIENLAHEQRRHWDGREFDEYIIATEGMEGYQETPEQYICRTETLDELMTILDSCTEVQRNRFLLYALDGLSLAEIGKLCGCSKYAVRDSIKAARKIFKNFFKNHPHDCPCFGLPSERDYFPYPSGRRTADELPASPVFRR